MLDKETFLDSLRERFRDDVQMIIIECHKTGRASIDVNQLNEKLKTLHSYVLHEELTEDDWLDLIYDVTPDIYQKLHFSLFAA